MLFHMYIERKIFFIQRFYRNYLKSRKDSIKINLEYIYNINKILLIQKMWKKINKKRLNQNLENNNDSILKKSIPFKLDNFDINDNTDSNIEIKTEENKNENIYNKKNKFKYISKKLQIKQEINFFLLSKKREELLAIELQRKTNNIKIKYFNEKDENIFHKNISFEIINHFNDHINNIFYQPFKTNMFITKEYKIKKPNINKKKIILNYNNITKVRLNKNKIINKIILIQKIIKEYINSKNRKYIQKPNTKIYFFEKLRRLKNLWDYSSHNKIESLSFKGNYFIDNSNSNKDKTNENEISNPRSEKINSFIDNYKQKSSINYNNNLFSYENSNGKNNNNNDSFKTLLLKDKLKNIFKRYFSFKLKLNINLIIKYAKNIKFTTLIEKYIFNKIHKTVFNIFNYKIYQ